MNSGPGNSSAGSYVRKASGTGTSLAAGMLLILLVIGVVDAALRKATGGSIAGLLGYSELLMAGVVFLPLAGAAAAGQMVEMTLVYERAPQRVKLMMTTVRHVVVIAFLATMVYLSIAEFSISLQEKERRVADISISMWPARLAVALGFSGWLIWSIIDAYKQLRKGRGRGRELEHDVPPAIDVKGDK